MNMYKTTYERIHDYIELGNCIGMSRFEAVKKIAQELKIRPKNIDSDLDQLIIVEVIYFDKGKLKLLNCKEGA